MSETPVSNARLIAELQAATIAIHMFGLDALPNTVNQRVKETPENEHVPLPQPPAQDGT